MSEELENLIRRWARTGDAPTPPAAPTDCCLSFEQAARIARGATEPAPQMRQHIGRCDRCRKLLADFAEAFTEAAPAVSVGEAVRVRLLTPARLAAAAAVLLAVGVGVLYCTTRGRDDGPLLAAADVGLWANSGGALYAKGQQEFAGGQRIAFRVDLERAGYVALLHLDAAGYLTAVPPQAYSTKLSRKMAEGTATLGPYRAGEVIGPETWFVVVTEEELMGLRARLRRLPPRHDPLIDPPKLAEKLRSWPAEVKLIRFENVPPKD